MKRFDPPLAYGGHAFKIIDRLNEDQDFEDPLEICIRCGQWAPLGEISLSDRGWLAFLSPLCGVRVIPVVSGDG